MIRGTRAPKAIKAALAPKAPAPTAMTWANVVDDLRSQTEAQRWRLSGIRNLTQWQDFVVGWLAVGQELSNSIPTTLELPSSVGQGFDARLAWAWEQVEEIIPMALAVADDRTILSSVDTEFHFRVLQGTALIFPDGSLSPLLTAILSAQADTMSLQAQVTHNRSLRDALNSANEIRAIQKAKEKEA